MHDRNMGKRVILVEMVGGCLSNDGGRWKHEAYGGRWRLWDALPDYSEPWKTLTWEYITQEYPNSNVPIADYLKHLSRRYEGEVALASENVQRFAGPVPREKMLWHPQFCKRQAQVPAMTALAARGKRTAGTSFSDEVDLLAIGSTTIIRFLGNQPDGHYRLSGGAITLMELFARLGQWFTAQEWFCWYRNASKMVVKRPHAWWSPDVRAAAHLRKQEYNHWGHRRGGRRTWQV